MFGHAVCSCWEECRIHWGGCCVCVCVCACVWCAAHVFLCDMCVCVYVVWVCGWCGVVCVHMKNDTHGIQSRIPLYPGLHFQLTYGRTRAHK